MFLSPQKGPEEWEWSGLETSDRCWLTGAKAEVNDSVSSRALRQGFSTSRGHGLSRGSLARVQAWQDL